MSDLIERAKTFTEKEVFTDGFGDKARRLVFEYESEPKPLNAKTGWIVAPIADKVADFAQSERTRIADELEALSQNTPVDAMVTALLEYADKLRKND